jgi:hypothetical protein
MKKQMGWLVLAMSMMLCLTTSANAAWTKTTMPDGGFVYSLAAVGTDLYAATENGLFRSADLGENWSPTGLTSVVVQDLAVSGGSLFALTGGVLKQSTNNGASWTNVSLGAGNSVSCIDVTADAIWVGVTLSSGGYLVRYSSDLGITWSTVYGVLDASPNGVTVTSTKVIAGTTEGLYVSERFGPDFLPWNLVFGSQYIYAVTHSSSLILASAWEGEGVLASDNGTNFWPLPISGSGLIDIHTVMVDGSKLYAGSRSGIYASDDNGNTWSVVGLPSSDIYAFARIGTHLFAAAGCGVARSDNDGSTWALKNHGLQSEGAYVIADHDGALLMGTPSGLYRTIDNGATWSLLGLSGEYVLSLTVDGPNIYAGARSGLWRSTDGGAHFNRLTPLSGFSYSTYSMLVTPSVTLIGGFYTYGIFRSIDQGAIWTNVDSSIAPWPLSFAQVGSTLLFGHTGINRSQDNGETWNFDNSGSLAHRAVIDFAVIGTSVYAATDSGVWISMDEGVSWSSISSGLTGLVTDLASRGDDLYATAATGLYVLHEGSPAWAQESNAGLVDTRMASIAAAGNNIFAITQAGRPGVAQDGGRDVWTYSLGAVPCCQGNRGNVNGMGPVDISDLSLLVAYLTQQVRPVISCTEAANVTGTGGIDLSDLSMMISYMVSNPRPSMIACP